MDAIVSEKKPNAIKRLWQWIQEKIFRKKTVLPVGNIPLTETEREAMWNQFVQKKLEFPEDDEKLLESINTHIFFSRDVYRGIGIIDGKIPAKDYAILTLTTNQATRLVEHVCSKLAERIESLKEKIRSKKSSVVKEETQFERWQYFVSEMTRFYHNSSQQFSLVTAWICIILGFILMIADIPLSIALVGHLNIGSVRGNSAFMKKLADPELLLFSLGIAFSTVYIKILYDEYINTRLGTWSNVFITNFNSAYSLPEADTHQSDRILSVKGEFYLKLGVRLMILAILIVMLVYLGYFRNIYSKISPAMLFPVDRPDKPGTLDLLTVFNPTTVIHIRLYSFILMTLVIPIVSGVALSTGFSILHNYRIFRKSKLTLTKINNELKQTINELSELMGRLKKFDIALTEWNQKGHKIQVIADEFASFYEQGYKTSFHKTFGDDLFKQVEEARSEFMNRIFKSNMSHHEIKRDSHV